MATPTLKGISRPFEDARKAIDAFLADEANLTRLDELAALLVERFGAGGKVLACGNGGSACDAMHFCEELTGRFRAPPPGEPDRRPLAAMACTDAGHITCVANDFGYDRVFERWVQAHARENDVVFLLSTSGNSPSVMMAARAARDAGATTVALLGKTGGLVKGMCDFEWVVAAAENGASDRIQEVHMLVLHALIELVEDRLPAAE